MNAKFELEVLSENSNEIVEAFKTEGGAQSLFDRIATQARTIVPDLSTDKGRKEIASIARKVASTKTAFDAHGKALKEQYTVITNKIDADRKLFRDQCDALRDEIRKPLTDWENAKKAREAEIQNKIAEFDKGRIDIGSPAELIKSVIAEIESIEIDDSFDDFKDVAKLRKYECLEHMKVMLIEREKFEAEQAELERLRIAEAERLQREREEQIAREAAERATREAEEKARFEAERVQREKLEAEQREAQLKAEKEAAELRAVQAAENERKRIEAEQFAQAEAARKAEEARLADVEHKKQICGEALKGLTDLGVSADQGKAILNAINKGLVPHVSIKF